MERVLFICVHNAGRSQMAEAFFNQLALEQGLDAVATSAGNRPATAVYPSVVQSLAEVGLSIEGQFPKGLTPTIRAWPTRVITLSSETAAPAPAAEGDCAAEAWDVPDPRDEPIEAVREIRDTIHTRVATLIQTIVSGKLPG